MMNEHFIKQAMKTNSQFGGGVNTMYNTSSQDPSKKSDSNPADKHKDQKESLGQIILINGKEQPDLK